MLNGKKATVKKTILGFFSIFGKKIRYSYWMLVPPSPKCDNNVAKNCQKCDKRLKCNKNLSKNWQKNIKNWIVTKYWQKLSQYVTKIWQNTKCILNLTKRISKIWQISSNKITFDSFWSHFLVKMKHFEEIFYIKNWQICGKNDFFVTILTHFISMKETFVKHVKAKQ